MTLRYIDSMLVIFVESHGELYYERITDNRRLVYCAGYIYVHILLLCVYGSTTTNNNIDLVYALILITFSLSVHLK